jgi:type I restriction enzyme S subunit
MSAGTGEELTIDPTKVREWKRYPEYTDSGVVWLGEVPKHWEVKRFKYCVILKSKKISGQETDLPYVGLENIEPWTGQFIQPEEPLLSDGQSTLFNSGDVLFGKLRPYLAKALRAQAPGICSSEFLVLRPVDVTSDFLANYILNRDFIQAVDASTYGTKMPRANWEFIGNLPMLIPPLPEQHAIAAFLDRETARLDALIAKKQRFIELLEEKRQALITQAVTKGLDPDVEMKDSGVEWLGEVPVGWKVIKLKYAVSIRNGQVNPEIEPYCHMVLVAPNHIESKTGKIVSLETASEQQAESGKYQFYKGDVLYCKIRPHLQKACLPEFGGICSADMYSLQPKSGVHNKFLLYVLLSDYFKKYTVDESMRVAMPKVNRESLGNCIIAVPSLTEQKKIVSSIESLTEKIDLLLGEINLQLEKLHEYRTALITAAVTGKIDVRGEIPADP